MVSPEEMSLEFNKFQLKTCSPFTTYGDFERLGNPKSKTEAKTTIECEKISFSHETVVSSELINL